MKHLVFTSWRRGLKTPHPGFCTVAMTPGLSDQMRQSLENLSNYRIEDESSATSPNLTHMRILSQGMRRHMFSRIAPCHADYSGRTNTIAHHIVIDPEEESDFDPLGYLDPGVRFYEQWEGDPCELDASNISSSRVPPPKSCSTWEEATGDAGHAGAVWRAFKDSDRTIVVLVPPGTDRIALIRELLALVPKPARRKVTFSTASGADSSPDVECRIRFRIDCVKSREEIARLRSAIKFDLISPKQAESSVESNCARSGTPFPTPTPSGTTASTSSVMPPKVSSGSGLKPLLGDGPQDQPIGVLEGETAARRSQRASRALTHRLNQSLDTPQHRQFQPLVVLGACVGSFLIGCLLTVGISLAISADGTEEVAQRPKSVQPTNADSVKSAHEVRREKPVSPIPNVGKDPEPRRPDDRDQKIADLSGEVKTLEAKNEELQAKNEELQASLPPADKRQAPTDETAGQSDNHLRTTPCTWMPRLEPEFAPERLYVCDKNLVIHGFFSNAFGELHDHNKCVRFYSEDFIEEQKRLAEKDEVKQVIEWASRLANGQPTPELTIHITPKASDNGRDDKSNLVITGVRVGVDLKIEVKENSLKSMSTLTLFTSEEESIMVLVPSSDSTSTHGIAELDVEVTKKNDLFLAEVNLAENQGLSRFDWSKLPYLWCEEAKMGRRLLREKLIPDPKDDKYLLGFEDGPKSFSFGIPHEMTISHRGNDMVKIQIKKYELDPKLGIFFSSIAKFKPHVTLPIANTASSTPNEWISTTVSTDLAPPPLSKAARDLRQISRFADRWAELTAGAERAPTERNKFAEELSGKGIVLLSYDGKTKLTIKLKSEAGNEP